MKTLQGTSTTGLDSNGDKICLPIELSEEDKLELGVTGRRKRKRRALESKHFMDLGLMDDVARFFGSILS